MSDDNALERAQAWYDDQTATLGSVSYSGGLKAALTATVALLLFPVSQFVRILPPSWRIYRKLARWSTYQMQKAANADAVANIRLQSGKEDLLPAAWVNGSEDDKDGSGWKVKGIDDRRYDPSVNEQDTQRFGKADLLHVDVDATEVGTWAEARMDAAIQADRERYLFRDAVVRAVFDVGSGPAPGDGALADGGLSMDQLDQFSYRMSVEQPGIHEDTLVPVNSPEGYDGQVVSFNRYSTLKEEQSGQEKVRDAKNQAWAAAKLDDIGGVDYLKWALIIGGWSALLLFKDAIAAAIAGIAGGGGGAGGAVGGAVSGGLGSMAPVAMDAVVMLGVV